MGLVRLAICFLDEEDNIITKRPLEATWSVDVEKDLKEKFNIYVEDEIAEILTEDLRLSLISGVVKEMLQELKIKKEKTDESN